VERELKCAAYDVLPVSQPGPLHSVVFSHLVIQRYDAVRLLYTAALLSTISS